MDEKPRIIVILGPTASGKSDLAVEIARRFNGEVISADSRQVYKGLDIGTGKVTKKEMRNVRHHLLDVISPKKQYSVAEYQHDATVAIHEIQMKNKIPILCGGTGFYVDAVVTGETLPDVPPNEKLRKKLESMNTAELFDMLTKLDPIRAEDIDKHNPRRLVRAIEIATALGSVPKRKFESPYNVLFIGITVPPEILAHRIHVRLRKRIRLGMVMEATRLHAQGLSWRRMEELGLEYRYLSRFLRKKISKIEMIEQLEREIIQYAKRQLTWFKRNKQIHWIPYNDLTSTVALVESFIKKSHTH